MLTILILFIVLLGFALWTVITARLIGAVIGLAVTSAVLSILIYVYYSPLAAMFELSVCAGLISVIFFTAISFTKRLSEGDLNKRRKEKFGKFWILPFIVLIVGLLLTQITIPIDFKVPPPAVEQSTRVVLWNIRRLDILGQIIVLLTGALGVIVLFKDRNV